MSRLLQLISRDDEPEGSLAIAGEIDTSSAPLLAQAIRRAARRTSELCIDMSRVSFIDSSGVHVITDALEDARRNQRRLTIAPSAPVRRVFTILGLEPLLEQPSFAH